MKRHFTSEEVKNLVCANEIETIKGKDKRWEVI